MSFQSDNQFPQRELFGGAVTSNIFSNFEDLSNFRPVPDHQEVYVDKSSKTSLTIELLDRQEIDDSNAAEYFFQDLVEYNQARQSEIYYSKVLNTQEVVPSMNPNISRCLLIGRQVVEKDHTVDDVLIYLLAIRLQERPVDILITLNSATSSSAISQVSSTIQENSLSLFRANSLREGVPLNHVETIFNIAINSFDLKDYSLFGSNDE